MGFERELWAHRSSLTALRSPLIAHRSSLTAHRSPLIAHRSSLTAHRSPLIAHRSSLSALRSPLIARRSSLTAHRSPLIAHRSSLNALVHLILSPSTFPCMSLKPAGTSTTKRAGEVEVTLSGDIGRVYLRTVTIDESFATKMMSSDSGVFAIQKLRGASSSKIDNMPLR